VERYRSQEYEGSGRDVYLPDPDTSIQEKLEDVLDPVAKDSCSVNKNLPGRR